MKQDCMALIVLLSLIICVSEAAPARKPKRAIPQIGRCRGHCTMEYTMCLMTGGDSETSIKASRHEASICHTASARCFKDCEIRRRARRSKLSFLKHSMKKIWSQNSCKTRLILTKLFLFKLLLKRQAKRSHVTRVHKSSVYSPNGYIVEKRLARHQEC